MKTITMRWHAIKELKANLALVVAGCLLVLLAVSWRLAIAPALEVVQTNIENVLFFNGTLTRYVNPPGQPPLGDQPAQVPVRIERRIRSLPVRSTPSIAIFEVETAVIARDSADQLSVSKHLYAVDRRTGKMVKNAKSDRERSGYCLVFPYNTTKANLPYWSELTGKTYPARYQKSEVVDKVGSFVFQTGYGGQTVAEPPAGFPAELTGAELKLILSMPDLPVVGASEVFHPSYFADERKEMVVEPRSGTIVEERGGQESVSLAVSGAGGETLVTRLLYKLDYTQDKASVLNMAEFALDQMAKVRLQFEYIPVGLLVIGAAVFLIGAFAGVKVGKEVEKIR